MTAFGSYTRRRLVFSVLPFFLIAIVFAGVGSLTKAHAAGFPGGAGQVCLNDPSAVAPPPANPCPTNPYSFDGPNPSTPQVLATQIQIGVFVNGSASLNSFDITLLSNHTILSPSRIDFTGSIVPGATIVTECFSGLLVTGTACLPSDNVDTLHLAVAASPGSSTTAPSTGLLFTAIFNIVGTASTGGTPVGFQSGCTNTSVSGGVCVTLANGSATPDAETVQTGSLFDNLGNTVPWLAETSNSTTITVARGATSGNSVAITTIAENGWPGFSPDSISFASTASGGFAPPALSASSCSPAACTVVATVNTGGGGTYSVTIYGTYVAFDTNGLTSTLVAPVTFQVTIQDVAWTINNGASSIPQTDYIAHGANMPLVFTAQSQGGYAGTVTYSTSLLTDGGTGISLVYPTTFTLTAGATVTRLVNATATTSGSAVYEASLNATGLAVRASAPLTIKVSGFSLSTNSTILSFASGKSRGISVMATSLGNPPATNGFAGPVAISSVVSGPGKLTVTCPSSIILTAGSNPTGICSFTSATAGNYTITIEGKGGTNNDITNSTSTITVAISSITSYNLSVSPTSITLNARDTGTSTIKVGSTGIFSQPVSLTTIIYPTGPACNLTPSSVSPPAGDTATSTLSCSGLPGTYTMTVVASTTGFSSKTATLVYTIQDFSLVASSVPPSTLVGTPITSTITVTAINGFSGIVSLITTSSPGLTASLSTTSVTGSGTSTLTLSSSAPGTYSVSVTATSSSLVHTTGTITVIVRDFQIFASPTMVTTTPSTGGTSIIIVLPVNGFSGTVALATSISPTTGLSCSISPTSITGGSGNGTLMCAGSGGTYVVTVTGTSGSVSHTTMVTVNVQDFAVVTNASSVLVAQGGCTSSTVDVVSVGGFVGTVSLTSSTSSGITATLTPTTIINSGTSTGIICAATNVAIGSYQVTVTGASGSSSHQSTISITVTPGTSTPPPILTQTTWNHRFSLSKYNNIQTWKLGASNPSTVTEYVSVQIIGIDGTGSSGFTLGTPVIALAPGQNLVHIALTQTFSGSQVGETFTFNISVQWGLTATTDPNALPFNSTASNGQPTSGSFTILQ